VYKITAKDPWDGVSKSSYFILNETGLCEGEYNTYQEAKLELDILNGTFDNGFNVLDELKDKTLEELQEIQKSRQKNFAVACINVDGDLNISNLIRSAVIFGANAFYIIGKKKFDRRGCVGAQNYIDIKYIEYDPKYDAPEKALELLLEQYTLVALEQDSRSMNLSHVDSMIPGICLLLGSEGKGLPKDILDAVDFTVEIPQVGIMRSLNVSSAGAIAMYEISKGLRGN